MRDVDRQALLDNQCCAEFEDITSFSIHIYFYCFVFICIISKIAFKTLNRFLIFLHYIISWQYINLHVQINVYSNDHISGRIKLI